MNALQFLRGIVPEDDIVVIFNNDADGICSCILLGKMLEKIGAKKPYIISQPMPPDKDMIRRIQTTLPSKIILLDMAIDQVPVTVKKIKGMCDMLVIDHHQVFNDLNKQGIVHYNPRLSSPKVYQSASYLVYKLCSEIIDMKEFLWIAGVGMVADYNLEFSGDLVDEIKKAYMLSGNLYNTLLGRIADMISAAKATKMLSCEQMAERMKALNSPQEIENISELIESYRIIDNEMISIMADADSRHEKKGRVIFYGIKSKYNLGSPVSTKLSEKHKGMLIIVYEKKGSKIKVSARNQDGMNVAAVLKKAAAGMKASAGGHDAAAGASLQEKDWETFKQRVIEVVG